mgnify:FL=1
MEFRNRRAKLRGGKFVFAGGLHYLWTRNELTLSKTMEAKKEDRAELHSAGRSGDPAAGREEVGQASGAEAPASGAKKDAAAEAAKERTGGAAKTASQGLPERKFPTIGDLFAMLGVVLGAQVVIGLLGMLFLQFAVPGSDFKAMAPEALGRFNAVVYVVSMAAALGGLLYYRRARGGRGRWACFSTRGLNPALLLWGFVLICAAGVVLEPLLAQLPDLSLNLGRGLWTLLMLVLFAPVLEELICRGLVLGTLRARYGVTLAWLVSALFFGVMHLQPVQVINAFVVGLILGYVYISTDSLWSVMILHAMNNAVAYLMMITGHANTLLIDLIHSRVVYVAVYVVAVALLIVSGRMMLRALRRIKEAEKNRAAA